MQTYTFRVLNEYDQSYDFDHIGLASKQVIYDIVKTSLSSNKKIKFIELSKEEQDNLIRESIIPYLKLHEKKLPKKFERSIKFIREYIYKFVNEKDDIAYLELLYSLTSLNKHLGFGSTMITDWISATTNFDSIFKYYDKQKVHKVAVIAPVTNGVYETDAYMPFYRYGNIDYAVINKNISKYFPIFKIYTMTVPTFPGGLFAFGFGSKKYDPIKDQLDFDFDIKNLYYNYDIHKSAFNLPEFMKKRIEEEQEKN